MCPSDSFDRQVRFALKTGREKEFLVVPQLPKITKSYSSCFEAPSLSRRVSVSHQPHNLEYTTPGMDECASQQSGISTMGL